MRIQSIDILRGIAILGILFMNVYYHGFFAVGYVSPALAPLSDTLVDLFNGVFVDGRFRSLFCLLFGVGLAIQYQSYKKKDISPRDAIKPRLKWLMLFGVLHGVFIFGGDVLLLYSVTAWFALKSLNLPQDQLRKKAIRYLVIGAVLNLSWSALILYFSEPPLVQGSAAFMELYNEWFSSYGIQMIIQSAVAMIIVVSSPLWVFWQVAGLMMLGAYLYRNEFFTKGFEQNALIKVIIGAVIFTGLDVVLRLQLAAASTEVSALFASVSAVFVALIYAHIVVKLVANGSRIINLFAAPGKLAFSLYISQSIVGAIVLRWMFPEFHLTSTQIDYVYIALAYSAIQIVLAHVYLRFFKQGPLEYIWRKAYTRTQQKKQLLTPASQVE
ncbi:conserved hypothetical protein [Vibrio nigripulchritudo MADA3029]|uniref:DUF418 domain-containing protein n=1 Tax=Vibrio nigripulchritudo TaxID=28173 RepID=UPI0003B1D581|nr:DUF418 domain-containing protein [Vibrio nigripulchritudo]CCN46517.1 conserved hypothetical protein [Vibrio nigripulchritudo MADA3020]CCN53909.1 conserved hypothetical protein [Vibrio nigripulchritudo MADA3021]CCN62461.1 conserved hypothetical protein [Vibrio nigripulchritudo MADA3029]